MFGGFSERSGELFGRRLRAVRPTLSGSGLLTYRTPWLISPQGVLCGVVGILGLVVVE
jgi:hypothetical protein